MTSTKISKSYKHLKSLDHIPRLPNINPPCLNGISNYCKCFKCINDILRLPNTHLKALNGILKGCILPCSLNQQPQAQINHVQGTIEYKSFQINHHIVQIISNQPSQKLNVWKSTTIQFNSTQIIHHRGQICGN